jgi:hypothetical protein
MGEAPQWYSLVAAARYLGVDPWVLETKPVLWVHRAIAARNAEAHADEMAQKHAR